MLVISCGINGWRSTDWSRSKALVLPGSHGCHLVEPQVCWQHGYFLLFPKSISDAWVLVYFTLPRRGDNSATTGWTDGKPWEIAWGELSWEGARRKRWHGGTVGKPWEIAWGELRWKGATRNRRQGWTEGKTVGNSLGRASLGGSDTEATTGWTDGRPWDSLGRAPLGGSDTEATDRVDGRETVGNSLGRALLGGSGTEATTGWTDGKPTTLHNTTAATANILRYTTPH